MLGSSAAVNGDREQLSREWKHGLGRFGDMVEVRTAKLL
jgi:hypothetical protein